MKQQSDDNNDVPKDIIKNSPTISVFCKVKPSFSRIFVILKVFFSENPLKNFRLQQKLAEKNDFCINHHTPKVLCRGSGVFNQGIANN